MFGPKFQNPASFSNIKTLGQYFANLAGRRWRGRLRILLVRHRIVRDASPEDAQSKTPQKPRLPRFNVSRHRRYTEETDNTMLYYRSICERKPFGPTGASSIVAFTYKQSESQNMMGWVCWFCAKKLLGKVQIYGDDPGYMFCREFYLKMWED